MSAAFARARLAGVRGQFGDDAHALDEGLIYRGGKQYISQAEQDALRPAYDYRTRVFSTWVEEELVEYEQVMAVIAMGDAILRHVARLPVPEQGGWRILLEWGLPYYTDQ